MGVQGSPTGVTLEFKDVTGTQDLRPSVTGTISSFYAKERPESPGSLDTVFGSQDWLTDIMIVDQQPKLANLLPSQTEVAFTSASSKRVFVQWDVAGDKGNMHDCLTIATGNQASVHDPLVADKIIVLPAETPMKPGHALFGLWAAQASKSLPTRVKLVSAVTSASSTKAPGVTTVSVPSKKPIHEAAS